MVGGTRRRHSSSGSTSPCSGGESAAGSEWDVIEWSEQNSPATEHFSIRTIWESELIMNRDTRDLIFHPENKLDEEDKHNESGYTDPQQLLRLVNQLNTVSKSLASKPIDDTNLPSSPA